MDEAAEYLEDQVRSDIRANETAEEIEADEDSLRELYFSYYSIEEVAELEDRTDMKEAT